MTLARLGTPSSPRSSLRLPPLPAPALPRALSVCLYTPSADPSGMGEHLLLLAREHLAHGPVSVLAWPTVPGRRLLERAAALGAEAVALPHPRDPGFAGAVEGHLGRSPADVFHVHVGTGREDFDGARAARRAGVPAVVQTLHLPWLLGSRKHRVPLLHSLEAVDRVITVSLAQRRTYLRAGVPGELLTTVPNGVLPRGPGPGREAARAALGVEADRPVVLTVGRLVAMKGQRHLVDAVPELLRRVPEAVVVLVGGGHLEQALRDQAAALGVQDAVRLVGARTDARALLDAADVFVLPSLTEGMPLALLEAMDAGLPAVATRVIGTEEVVRDGETGLLVRPRDPAALAGALGRLLHDPPLRRRLGASGRALFLDTYTSARTAEETRAVYREVLAGRQPLPRG